MTKKPKYKVKIDKNLCKACKYCVNVCPMKILKLGQDLNKKGYHPATCTDETKCIGCDKCARICPEAAIEIENT